MTAAPCKWENRGAFSRTCFYAFPSASSLLKQQGTFSSVNEVALLSVILAIMKNNKSSPTQHQGIVFSLVNLIHIRGILLNFSDI